MSDPLNTKEKWLDGLEIEVAGETFLVYRHADDDKWYVNDGLVINRHTPFDPKDAYRSTESQRIAKTIADALELEGVVKALDDHLERVGWKPKEKNNWATRRDRGDKFA